MTLFFGVKCSCVTERKEVSVVNSDQNGCPILELCENGQIYSALEEYLLACTRSESPNSDDTAISDGNSKKSKKQEISKNSFPNLAGFCRHLRISTLDFDEAAQRYPSHCARILTVLEDEALNSGFSPNLISAYLKKRLGYDSPQKGIQGDTQLHIQFEHDIFEDGE